MKVQKGRALIITDPCTFVKDEDWGDSSKNLGFDYENLVINAPEFSDYIWVPTGFGDGTGTVYESDNPQSQYELEEAIIKFRNDPEHPSDKFKNLGEFCVDSGTFGVFYLDEVLRYNPDYTLDVGSWCYTIIKDFEGAVYETQLDDSDENSEDNYCYNYIIGSGNKSFCTVW